MQRTHKLSRMAVIPNAQRPTCTYCLPVLCVVLQSNELVEMLQERVRELEAEAEANRQQLEATEQQLKDSEEAKQ